MDAERMLENSRTLTLVVDGSGMIEAAAGGFGGFLDVSLLAGTNVFDHVAPEDADELALYFIENVDDDNGTAALPMPFRLTVLGLDREGRPADIIPTGHQNDDGTWTWTVVVVPLSLTGSITQSLDLEMEGASRDDVRRMLCEELAVDNTTYTARWALIDLSDDRLPKVVTSRREDDDVADAIGATIVANDWTPWSGIAQREVVALDVHEFPEPLVSVLGERGWQRSVVAPVYVNGEVVAAFLMVGVVPEAYDKLGLKANQVSRIGTLTRATEMLTAKWIEHDQLTIAANTDSLTGLANRDAFFEVLESEPRVGALLYIDIDRFKTVNDRFGHAAGDAVLVQVAERIASSCRRGDIVSRFGGDEFVVLLRGAPADVARTIAERIIEAVSAPLPDGAGVQRVSVSVGMSMLSSGEQPLEAADAAMLSAKRDGRGRLVLAHANDQRAS